MEDLCAERQWVCEAVRRLNADFNRSSDTHLIRVDLPGFPGQVLYLKDESIHPSGSLKHRLARSLYLYGICNGAIGPDTVVVESSSGSTAVSEAYFAKLLGLRFIAVVPEGTAQKKIDQIAFYGGETRAVPASQIYDEAERIARETGGHYMDQFTFAERATDWRGNNNIAESLFQQMAEEPRPVPDWVVVGAGTGGTSATIGRYIRYCPDLFAHTKLCVVDPEHSVFYPFFQDGNREHRSAKASRIEGIGRPRVEPSFLASVIDRMIPVPDAASIATIWWLESILDRKCGGSTGTNVYGCLKILAEHSGSTQPLGIASMLCDPGERYLDTYYNPTWLKEQDLDIEPYLDQLNEFQKTGTLTPVP